MICHRIIVRAARALTLAATATILSATLLVAHDFWIVPNALSFATGGAIEILGQSGSKFPTSSSATPVAQVAEARIVGASRDEKITDLSVNGRSLVIRHKPDAAGQYVVAVALASRDARTTPARLQRYLELEGAPELAARYAADGVYPKADSVNQTSAKFAKTLVQVGSGGARTFSKPVGHALELMIERDPAELHKGDSVRVRLLYRGKPVNNVALRAGAGPLAAVSDSAAAANMPKEADQVVTTGRDGAATVRITADGLWNVRTLYATAMQGMPEHWEMFFATLVFPVGGGAHAHGDMVKGGRR